MEPAIAPRPPLAPTFWIFSRINARSAGRISRFRYRVRTASLVGVAPIDQHLAQRARERQ
jgi:hypothetical protein